MVGPDVGTLSKDAAQRWLAKDIAKLIRFDVESRRLTSDNAGTGRRDETIRKDEELPELQTGAAMRVEAESYKSPS